MKVLVTGGAGFIGSNFIRHILSSHPDFEVVNLDNLTYAADLRNLDSVSRDRRYKFVKGDICNPDAVEKTVAGCDWIVNFAAETHVDNSIESSDEFVKTNVFGTLVLLKAALRHGVSRFMQVSTDEVYGSKKSGVFKETDVLAPSNPYSASKAAAEHLVFSYHKTFGLPVVVSRSSNNFGPFQHPEKFIPKIITRALNGKKIPVYGTGLNRRDWLFVEDNCRGIDTVLLKGKPGEAYNIGGGNDYPNLFMVKSILKKMKKPAGLIEFVKDRKGHDFRYALGSEKLKRLGWKPLMNFSEALDYTVDWYAQNEWWWASKKS